MLPTLIIYSLSVLSVKCSVVVTTSGPVRGKLNYDVGVYYYSYEGIPYAENPTGELRFKAPVPKTPWHDVFDATHEGAVCPQPEGRYNRLQMSEDCLMVNIYVPANATHLPLPVYTFINGGGFKILSGYADVQYGPQFIVERDVIFATVNYRLGALGYLSLETKEAPGNAGLKDILLGLKWINANIQQFGGDNKKITLGGSSSGAAATHYMLLTEKSTGLFHQALLASGSAASFRFIDRKPKETALDLAKELGLKTDDTDLIIGNLTTIDAYSIVDAQENMYIDTRSEMRPFGPFVPCIEPASADAVVTRDPMVVISAGMPQNVRILSGYNSLEGIYQWGTIKKNKKLTELLREKFPACIPPDIEYPKGSLLYQRLVESISQLYFGDTSLSNWTLHNFLELLSDTQYTFNVDYWVKMHARKENSKPLYYYLFDFDGELNWAKLNVNVTEVPGTAHADDLGYVFVTKVTRPLLENVGPESRRMMDILITYYTNFIKYGNPTPDYADYVGDTWSEYGADANYMHITDTPVCKTGGPNSHRVRFWYEAYEKYHKYAISGGRYINTTYTSTSIH